MDDGQSPSWVECLISKVRESLALDATMGPSLAALGLPTCAEDQRRRTQEARTKALAAVQRYFDRCRAALDSPSALKAAHSDGPNQAVGIAAQHQALGENESWWTEALSSPAAVALFATNVISETVAARLSSVPGLLQEIAYGYWSDFWTEKAAAEPKGVIEREMDREVIAFAQAYAARCAAVSPKEPAAESVPKGMLGGNELADALGIHESRREAFFQAIGRKRKELGDGNWEQVQERRPNAPEYVYRVDAPLVLELAKRYQSPMLA